MNKPENQPAFPRYLVSPKWLVVRFTSNWSGQWLRNKQFIRHTMEEAASMGFVEVGESDALKIARDKSEAAAILARATPNEKEV